MHRAFWDIQRTNLYADPPNYEPSLGLLKEVKEVGFLKFINLFTYFYFLHRLPCFIVPTV